MRTFRGGDELNHFFWTAEPVLDAIGLGAESLYCQLRGDTSFRETCVLSDEANLVDADAGVAFWSKELFEPVGERGYLRAGFHEGSYEVCELVALDVGSETDAGDARSGEQIGKATLCGGGFERYAVKEKLRTRGTQQKAALASGINCCDQLAPSGVELASGAGML
jgi:hypothetical protein